MPIHHLIKRLTMLSILMSSTLIGSAQIELSQLIADGMVLQRQQEVALWGWIKGAEEVKLEFRGQTYTAKANSDRKWKVSIPAMEAGGPYSMTISSLNDRHQINDIFIGDVWLCSGQSNMEWPVAFSNNPEEEIAAAKDTRIRQFYIPHIHSESLSDRLAESKWSVCSPETVGEFTAVGYYFARELRKHVDVPIGLIHSSWGGSRLEPWMHPAALNLDNGASIMEAYKAEQKRKEAAVLAQLEKKHGPLPKVDKTAGGATEWIALDYDDKDWDKVQLPALWEEYGYENLDGTGWFRKTIQLSAEDIQKEVTLILGKIDDTDVTWINGVKVGGMVQSYNILREYKVPATTLKVGKNVIAVWVEDTGGGGGIYGEKEELYFTVGAEKRSLVGEWHFKVGSFSSSALNAPNQIPTVLYNKMIHPLHDFPIKGVLWYQGESNAGEDSAEAYRKLFPLMIKDWRARWKIGDFPFLFVQLANYLAPDDEPAESSWAVLRESQSATLAVPNTAQAVIIDIGEADDIHPRNKQDVGYRLSLAARKLAYKQDLVYSGPVYRSAIVRGKELVLSFDHIGSGLWAKDKYGYLKGFALAGSDGQFRWAKARLEGDKVIVWSEAIPQPVKVRYAWGNNPEDANLYNKEGLPASPFQAAVK